MDEDAEEKTWKPLGEITERIVKSLESTRAPAFAAKHRREIVVEKIEHDTKRISCPCDRPAVSARRTGRGEDVVCAGASLALAFAGALCVLALAPWLARL